MVVGGVVRQAGHRIATAAGAVRSILLASRSQRIDVAITDLRTAPRSAAIHVIVQQRVAATAIAALLTLSLASGELPHLASAAGEAAGARAESGAAGSGPGAGGDAASATPEPRDGREASTVAASEQRELRDQARRRPTPKPRPSATPVSTPSPTTDPATPPPTPAAPTPASTAPPPPAPPPSGQTLLFGLGPTVDSAKDARLVREAPVRMLSVWYNGPGDLGWLTDAYHRGMYATQYAAGRALHLIVWTGDPEGSVSTAYGSGCGRAYPLSSRFVDDVRTLAGALSGSGTLYVTLFTEFQTYACADNAWNPNAETNRYWRALKDRYLEARAAIRAAAPNARVSLGWGGWQMRWDDAAIGGGRSMLQHFADVMGASDFQSFQAMQSDTNVGDVRAMTNALGRYGPVMLAHHKPNNGSQATFDADVGTMLTDAFIGEMRSYGLFAWSFMDQALISSEAAYQAVRTAVQRHGQ